MTMTNFRGSTTEPESIRAKAAILVERQSISGSLLSGEESQALVRYVLFNSVVVFAFAFAAVFLDGFRFLWEFDQTRFSFLIIGIYALITVYIGLAREKVNADAVYFVGNRLTSIGLVGTVIGIMLLMHSVGSSNINDVGQVFTLLVKGMSTLLITTLCGMGFSLMVDFQMWAVFGREAK